MPVSTSVCWKPTGWGSCTGSCNSPAHRAPHGRSRARAASPADWGSGGRAPTTPEPPGLTRGLSGHVPRQAVAERLVGDRVRRLDRLGRDLGDDLVRLHYCTARSVKSTLVIGSSVRCFSA